VASPLALVLSGTRFWVINPGEAAKGNRKMASVAVGISRFRLQPRSAGKFQPLGPCHTHSEGKGVREL